MTSKELDERIRAELLDLLKRVVPEGGLKYENIELLKKHVDLTIDSLKPTIRDCIKAVTPERLFSKKSWEYMNTDERLTIHSHDETVDTIEANTKELLG